MKCSECNKWGCPLRNYMTDECTDGKYELKTTISLNVILLGVKRMRKYAKKLLIGLKRNVFLMHLKVKIQQEKVLSGLNPLNKE